MNKSPAKILLNKLEASSSSNPTVFTMDPKFLVKQLVVAANKLEANDRRFECQGKDFKIPKEWDLVNLPDASVKKYDKPRFCYKNAFNNCKKDPSLKLYGGMFFSKKIVMDQLSRAENQSDYQYHMDLSMCSGAHAWNVTTDNKIYDSTLKSDECFYLGVEFNFKDFDEGWDDKWWEDNTTKSFKRVIEAQYNTGILLRECKLN